MLPLWKYKDLTDRINHWESNAVFYTIDFKSYNLPQPTTPSLPDSFNPLSLQKNLFIIGMNNEFTFGGKIAKLVGITSEHFIFKILGVFWKISFSI